MHILKLVLKAIFCLVMSYALTAMTVGMIANYLEAWWVPLFPIAIVGAVPLWLFLSSLEPKNAEQGRLPND